MKTARLMEKYIFQLSKAMGVIAIGFLIAMMLLTVADVLLRKLFNSPILGSVELVEVMMIFTGFLGLAWCAFNDSHIKVDLIVGSFPPRVQNIIDSITYLLTIVICAILSWRSIIESFAVHESNAFTPTLKIPLYPFYIVVGIGFGVLLLAVIVLFIKSLNKAIKP